MMKSIKARIKRFLQPFLFKETKIYGITYFGKDDIRYQKYVRKNRLTRKRVASIRNEIETFAFKPKISVVMPVYNVEQQWLNEAIRSVVDQLYPNWELCIADDASPAPHIRQTLARFSQDDPRIKVNYLTENRGISGASNEALALADGEFVAFLDHDDCLNPTALVEVVQLLNRHPDADIIYSDEDKLSMGGLRLRPVFKTAWDPDLFLTHNYLCHLVVCRRALIETVGGFRLGFEGSQDYDLLLRLTEITPRIYHIPRVLYHWRMIPGSAASVVDAKTRAFERARQALEDAMTRRGICARVRDGERPGTFRIETE
ncbi:MAG: glycosyltransferase family 2 protein [Candidatus Omnitrophota bacterium]